MISQRAWSILSCPDCGGSLVREPLHARCDLCGIRYPVSGETAAQLDLRLRTSKSYHLEVDLSDAPDPDPSVFSALPAPAERGVELASDAFHRLKLAHGNRLTPDLAAHFPRATKPGFMLDLGCGDREFADVCKLTNLEYIGMDYTGRAPDVLGDAHSLPFRDSSFDFVLSLAVLEHLKYPQIAMREAFRVLKPGGLFIGSVAFLEPFHMNSYYHHTHLGTYHSLASAGFEVEYISPNEAWPGVLAITEMSLFPRLPRFASNLLTLPLRMLHRLWWKAGHLVDRRPQTGENYRTLATTGGFRFIAHKPQRVSVTLSAAVRMRSADPVPDHPEEPALRAQAC